ncbi:MAG: hypothetical protein D6705_01665 [Deltaproteobacteria bacterium]|nr:MAG: hypothetical protein D6705_01665 [Deltaproteobacteria bacterium]
MPRATTSPEGGLLESVGRARRRGIALYARDAVLDVLVGAWIVVSCAIVATAATGRGDLARSIALIVVGGGAAGAWWFVRRGIRQRFGSAGPSGLRTTARTIARAGRHRTGTGHPIPRDLREELEAAVELATAPPLGAEALAAAYARRVAVRLSRNGLAPSDMLRVRGSLTRLRIVGVLVAAWALGATMPTMHEAARNVLEGIDARPPPPPEPLWTHLELHLAYPEHTGRTPRVLENPTGAFAAPAGTTVTLRLVPRTAPAAGAVAVAFEGAEALASEAATTTVLERTDDAWVGSFVLRGTGSATVVLFDDDGDALGRSAPIRFKLDPDRPPEVEFVDTAEDDGAAARADDVREVAFRARDDYGVATANLVYETKDGPPQRLPIPLERPGARRSTTVYRWDLSTIPVGERAELTYYVEVRDNDPGLGLDPLPDPPGKVARTPPRKLVVEDDDARHARNVASLAQIRDAAVDLLAERMMLAEDAPALAPEVAIGRLRTAFLHEEALLLDLAALVDAYAVDPIAAERRNRELAAIHARLRKLHEKEAKLQAKIPAEGPLPVDRAARQAPALLAHDRRMVPSLEDEVIRLDDLLDGEILERIEALLARLRATQRKIVDLLEQLAAGDTSVRPMLDDLMRRRREDLARLSQARAMLGREIDDEFLNEDALELLRQLEEEDTSRSPEAELERARRQLAELSGMHEAVQDRLGRDAGETSALSAEDRARMELLRALSRIEDRAEAAEASLREAKRAYRNAADMPAVSEADRNAMRDAARKLRARIDRVDDTELGRRGRAALLEAAELARRIEELADRKTTTVAEAYDAARALHDALGRARLGAEDGSPPARRLDGMRRTSGKLVERLEGGLPPAEQVLDPAKLEAVDEVAGQAQGVDREIRDLLDSRTADPLPEEGRRALRRALGELDGVHDAARERRIDEGIARARRATAEVRRAIDSLRRKSPPPPAGSRGEASTSAERDRSLRDLVMEALEGHDRERLGERVERYYEELLR